MEWEGIMSPGMLHLLHLETWMSDMWEKRFEWFRLKINKTSAFLIKKK
jgi:hypothetical protein